MNNRFDFNIGRLFVNRKSALINECREIDIGQIMTGALKKEGQQRFILMIKRKLHGLQKFVCTCDTCKIKHIYTVYIFFLKDFE